MGGKFLADKNGEFEIRIIFSKMEPLDNIYEDNLDICCDYPPEGDDPLANGERDWEIIKGSER